MLLRLLNKQLHHPLITKAFEIQHFYFLTSSTGVVRNFDWDGLKLEKFSDIVLITFFCDVVVMTSLK